VRRSQRLCIAGWLLTRAHAANAAPAVYVPPPACAARPVDFDAFIAALRVELGASGTSIDAAPSPQALVLSMEAEPCDSLANAVRIAVTGVSGKRLSRTVALVDVAPSTRPRTVALASAELVAEEEKTAEAPPDATEPAVTPAPSTASPPPAPVASAPSAANPAPPKPNVVQPAEPPLAPMAARTAKGSPHPLLGIGGEYRRYLGPGTSMYGLRVLTEWPLTLSHVVARVDVAGALGSSPSSLGTVSLEALAGAAGAEWLTAGDDFELALGVLAEAGYAHASGRANAVVASSPGSAATAAVGAIASMRGRIAASFWAALELTAGVELAGLRAHADEAVAGGVEGAYIGARFVAAYGR
jgi:hypothetical protein